jgi:hypothetical protein
MNKKLADSVLQNYERDIRSMGEKALQAVEEQLENLRYEIAFKEDLCKRLKREAKIKELTT